MTRRQHDPRTSHKRRAAQRRQGSVIVLVAVALVVVLAGVVLSVDVAFVHVAQTELKAVCDLSSMAAVEALTRTQSESQAVLAAKNTAAAHTVAGAPFQLATADIEFGRHRATAAGKIDFDLGVQPYTAVRITGRLTSSSSNAPIQSFFGSAFGIDEFETANVSVAAQLDRDVVLVLDISTSMSDDDRFEDMIDAANVFVDEVELSNETERVMIVSYNGAATLNQALTENPTVMRNAIASLAITTSGTAIGEGLLLATDSLHTDPLRRPLAQPVIILMTDGQHNNGIDPIDAVPTAAARRHVVNTITFSADADQSAMQAVANAGRGYHLHADDGDDLIDAFRQMAQSLELQLTD